MIITSETIVNQSWKSNYDLNDDTIIKKQIEI
jgi:hypothetical protein